MIDGNMKNRRDVCMAKDAGCIQYPGLPGHIRSGCTASPQFKSRFCQEHTSQASLSSCTDNKDGEPIIEMILEKKIELCILPCKFYFENVRILV